MGFYEKIGPPAYIGRGPASVTTKLHIFRSGLARVR